MRIPNELAWLSGGLFTATSLGFGGYKAGKALTPLFLNYVYGEKEKESPEYKSRQFYANAAGAAVAFISSITGFGLGILAVTEVPRLINILGLSQLIKH